MEWAWGQGDVGKLLHEKYWGLHCGHGQGEGGSGRICVIHMAELMEDQIGELEMRKLWQVIRKCRSIEL